MPRRLLYTFFALLIASTSFAAPPTLTSLSPAGGQRGTKLTVTCNGTFSWPTKVWAPGLDVTVGKKKGELEIAIPKDLPADRVWIRLFDAEGASIAAPFLIGDLPEIGEVEPNSDTRKPQDIAEPNVVINGVLAKAGDVDCFGVKLNAGQTLVASIDANERLGSPMDSMVQIATPDGFVLADNNDDVGLDPKIAFTAPKAGSYVVRIMAFPASPDSTINFSGSGGHVYRLTLTTKPFPTHTIPMVAKAGDDVDVLGWNVPQKTRAKAMAFGGKFAEFAEFDSSGGVRVPPETRLGFALLAGASVRVRLSSEPSKDFSAGVDGKSPRRLSLPVAAAGWLRKHGQNDVYVMPLKKGQRVVATVESAGLGLIADPALKVLGPDGNVVVKSNLARNARDESLTVSPAKDGDYRFVVTDRFAGAGPRHRYLLTVWLEQTDFELVADAEAYVAASGKPAEIKIKVKRLTGQAGSPGPITIEAVGLPKGIEAKPVISDVKGPTAAAVTLKIEASTLAFSGPIRVVGKLAKPAVIERPVVTPPRLGASLTYTWLTALQISTPKK